MSKQDIIFDLDQGLAAEFRALDLCKFLHELMADQEDKDKIRQIMSDEEKHIEIVKGLKNDIINHYQA